MVHSNVSTPKRSSPSAGISNGIVTAPNTKGRAFPAIFQNVFLLNDMYQPVENSSYMHHIIKYLAYTLAISKRYPVRQPLYPAEPLTNQPTMANVSIFPQLNLLQSDCRGFEHNAAQLATNAGEHNEIRRKYHCSEMPPAPFAGQIPEQAAHNTYVHCDCIRAAPRDAASHPRPPPQPASGGNEPSWQ